MFAKWILNLPNHLEGWTVHYPGRGSRASERPITRMANLIEQLCQAIQPYLNKPFIFFGYSMGGLVAFELTRALRKKQLAQPNILFVSAYDAPQTPDSHPKIHQLPDAEFVNELQTLNGIPPEILQNNEILQLLLPTLRADFEIIETYQYQTDAPLDCPIVAFGGRDDPRVSRERLEGWANQTASRFESHYFVGDHFFIHTARDEVMNFMVEKLG
jgi:medium-chain acyl-[acyl-carrier-protein] hydrolase